MGLNSFDIEHSQSVLLPSRVRGVTANKPINANAFTRVADMVKSAFAPAPQLATVVA